MTVSETPAAEEARARSYTVLAAPGRAENVLEIKRSEFLGYAARVETEAQAREHIEAVRRGHRDARHVCTAFVLGADREVQRSSDDGEPAGTAGIPMLQAILAHRAPLTAGGPAAEGERADLSDVCVAVVRYFGGIKLGAGGLVRAYTDAVASTLDAADLARRARLRRGAIEASHADAGRLENELRSAGYTVLGTDYEAAHAVLRLAVRDRPEDLAEAERHLASLTAGRRELAWAGTDWIDLPLG
ncbi:IMPACT family protein [Rothia sp. AR01]|uniref:IMPACT family protein n=1 Tax=Rothia santali TaxID=2949643 RepID=A0A9X2HEB1_9MICC|nr:YigZ family protein [Rothia santali]MCP3426132.1 IMPACT family protein [Rothia santali]